MSSVLQPTSVPVDEFLATLSPRRLADAQTLIAMMSEITGEQPAMWGPSIIGFGHVHYRYESGHEGDMGAAGFSPRKAAISVYIAEGFDRYGALLDRLGPHRIGASCLYITNLAKVDHQVLAELVRASYQHQITHWENRSTNAAATPARPEKTPAKPTTVEEYIASVPAAARPRFDELLALVRAVVPDAHEVLNYGVVGYKPDPRRRAVVFVSGWADHVALYPVPKDPDLADELEPYRRGKGTLWFPLDQPLPAELITRAAAALAGI